AVSPSPAPAAETSSPQPSAESSSAPVETAKEKPLADSVAEKPAAASSAADKQTSPAPLATVPIASPEPSAIPPKQAGPLVVHIKAREDPWLAVSVDGEVSTQGTLAAPAEKPIHADREITVRAGNVGALDFEFNGQKLPPQGGDGEVKTL